MPPDARKTDAELMKGGPGMEPEPEPTPEPEGDGLVELDLGHKKVMVTAEIAEALSARDRALQQQFSDLKAQFQRQAEPKAPVHEQPASDQDVEELFRDPQKYLSGFAKKIEQDVTSRVTSLYNQNEARKEYWRSFYDANKDLRGKEWVVDAVFARDYQELKDLPVGSGMNELAKRVRKRILDIAPTAKGERDMSKSHMEGGAPRIAAPAKEDKDDGPRTLGDVVRRRRQQAAGKTGNPR